MDQRVPKPNDNKTAGPGASESGRQIASSLVIPRDMSVLTRWVVQFQSDVLSDRRSVQPLAGWLLSGLIGLVVALTIVYAPLAFTNLQGGEDAKSSGVISEEAGYATIVAVALIALAVAFEPFLSRYSEDKRKRLRRWLGERHAVVRLPLTALVAAIWGAWQVPSVVLSFVDYLFARPFAWLVGVTQEGWRLRYACGGAVVFASIATGLFAPAPWGLYAVLVGIGAILAIVRRWSWSEADRETFLVERGIRQGAMRVGFKEDLRDEALVAVTFLFVLFPIGLRQIQLATCASGDCAFTLEGGTALPPEVLGQFVAWLGYFGAELAKSVPFVDWSEVFHVANDSPIKPQTSLGAQIVFAMRATLDLIMLAAVLQAVQIASRLRDQWTAFGASRLPILEPHTEKRLLNAACQSIEPSLEQHPTQQHAIATFPAYEDTRLKEVIQDSSGKMPIEARKTAVALLASQHAAKSTDLFFSEQEKAQTDKTVREWIVHVATGVTRERDGADSDTDRARLKVLLEDRFEAVSVRAAAARRLARMSHEATTTALLQECLAAHREYVEVRAAAALALARHKPRDSQSEIEKLAETLSDEKRISGSLLQIARSSNQRAPSEADASTLRTAAMATAHALARCAPSSDAQAVASAFAERIRGFAAAAARIQAEPMGIDDAKSREPIAALNQMVRIAAGEGPFGSTFTLGSSDGDELAGGDEKPTTEIEVTRPYAIGRYVVTQWEYFVFSMATGRAARQNPAYALRPAVQVNWRDAMAYCRWLEAVTAEVYRLPSDVEWEYACRAGGDTRWSWGNEWNPASAASLETRSGKGPTDVQSYFPNDWGLWQMHGNVYEWCADPWHDGHDGRSKDQEIWAANGDYTRRVIRGGSWYNTSEFLRSASRTWYDTDYRSNFLGFRLARTLKP